MGIIFFKVYWFGVNWLKFISRCDWLISFLFISELLFAFLHSSYSSFRVFLCEYWSFILRLAIFWLIFWNSTVTNFLKSTNSSIKRSSLPLFLMILMSSLILTSIVFGLPLISVSLFIWCFSLLISLIFSADFCLLRIIHFSIIWFLFLNLWHCLRCWSFLFLNCFYFEYFLNWFFSHIRLFTVSISTKCSAH